MRKLNENQIKQIEKTNAKMVGLIVKWVQKVGNENNNLNDDIELALDIIQEKQ
jgi:hypothetical protein